MNWYMNVMKSDPEVLVDKPLFFPNLFYIFEPFLSQLVIEK